RYRILVEQTSHMVSDHSQDGLVDNASPSCHRVLGYSPYWLIGKDPADFAHPVDISVLQQAYERLLTSGEPQSCQFRARRGDGGYTRIESSARPMRDGGDEITEIFVSSRDVSARVEAEERFRIAVEAAPIGMALLDLEGRWLLVNQALAELTGRTTRELVGMTFADITHPDDMGSDQLAMWRLRNGEISRYSSDKRYVRPDGSTVWVHLSVSLARDGNDRPQYFINHVQDIEERRATEARLTKLALTDPLTGIANRRVLHDRLDQATKRQRRNGSEICVIVVDLDGFKNTNDSFGHEAGDAILKEVANRLTLAVREEDTVARYGGDEFVIACALNEAEQFGALLDRIRMVCDAPIAVRGNVAELGASVAGVLVDRGEEPDDALKRADQAMHRERLLRQSAAPQASCRPPL
ncbi:MAG: PAS domain S-box protein, partial [Acidimicrobiales bacterium]